MFCRMSLNLSLFAVFLANHGGSYGFGGEKMTEVRCPSHHIISGVHSVSIMPGEVNLPYVAQVLLATCPLDSYCRSLLHTLFFGCKSLYPAHTQKSQVPPSGGETY